MKTALEGEEITVKCMFTNKNSTFIELKHKRLLPKNVRYTSDIWVDTYSTLGGNTLYQIYATVSGKCYGIKSRI